VSEVAKLISTIMPLDGSQDHGEKALLLSLSVSAELLNLVSVAP